MDEPLRALDWWYPQDELGEPKMEAVLAEINGWKTQPGAGDADGILFGGVDRQGNAHHGPQVADYNELKPDGSTACGCWIYSGVFNRDGVNKANARKSKDYLGHGWGFSWPSDRRIIYNRASAKPNGEPWSDRKKLVWWESEKWTGIDVPDFKANKPPDYRPRADQTGLDGQRGDAPFILHEDGLGWMYVPKGLQDGPFPTHYEPLESPVRNPLYSRDTNPVVNWFTRAENRFAPPGDPRFPFVLTTYRLTEHHTGGGMSRFLSYLSELQPEMFVEISPELARKLKVENSDYVCIVSLRGAIEARALVSRRIRPMKLNGKTVHQVAVPFHFGAAGPLRGNAANNLVAISGEPNVTIMESKALLCNIIPGRLPRGPDFLPWIERHAPQSGQPANLNPEQPPPGAPSGGKFSRSHGKEGKAG
jgi:formate dehydrogenase major subunit